MSNRLPSCAVVLAVVSSVAIAQTERVHEAHVHGRSQIDLVYESGALELELLAPGMDTVGFEHPPGNDEEAAVIANADAMLQSTASWLAFEPAASCEITEAKAHEHGYKATDEHDHEDGSHGHDDAAHAQENGDAHDHDGGHAHDGQTRHAEFHVSIKATCAEMPTALQIRLHERFPGLDMLRIDMITDAGQNRIELTRGRTRVPLSN